MGSSSRFLELIGSQFFEGGSHNVFVLVLKRTHQIEIYMLDTCAHGTVVLHIFVPAVPYHWITSDIARIISGLAKGANEPANGEAAKDPN